MEISEPDDDHHLGAISTRGAKAIKEKLKASNQAAREKMMVIMINLLFQFDDLRKTKFCARGKKVARVHSTARIHVISSVSEMNTELAEECLQMLLGNLVLCGATDFM